MKRRPNLKPLAFKPHMPIIGSEWRHKNGQRMRVHHVDVAKGIVWCEWYPCRGIMTNTLTDWRDWAQDAVCVRDESVPGLCYPFSNKTCENPKCHCRALKAEDSQ